MILEPLNHSSPHGGSYNIEQSLLGHVLMLLVKIPDWVPPTAIFCASVSLFITFTACDFLPIKYLFPCHLLGIGKFIALDFARRGARVILACRSEARSKAALQEIHDKTGNSDVHLRLVDLSALDSVREFAKRILEEEKALHILVNNAGVSGDPCV